MADGGEQLLTGTILGQLSQLVEVSYPSYPIKILKVEPLIDEHGDYQTVIRVVMASGTYYITITDYDPSEFSNHEIQEQP